MMISEAPSTDLLERYLRLLHVKRKPPCLDALTELVAAQAMGVPFENISKLYLRRHHRLGSLPGLERFLHGIETYHFGGTCYANNYYLYLLLSHLGYSAKLCGADMRNPDVHLVVFVEVDGREFLVDTGNAAPFMAPLPRDLDHDFVVRLGRDTYILNPQDPNGCSRMEMYRDGVPRHGYTAKPAARSIEEFRDVIAESYTDESTFMNALLLVRLFPGRAVMIHNLELIRSDEIESKIEPIADRNELAVVIEREFAIPASIAIEAIDELPELRDVWA